MSIFNGHTVKLVALQRLYEEKPSLVVKLLEYIDHPNGCFSIHAEAGKIIYYRKKERVTKARIA
jgi:hypothetical protein